MFLSWVLFLFFARYPVFYTSDLVCIMRVLCMRQKATPSLVARSSAALNVRYQRNYWPFSFHIAWAIMTGKSVVSRYPAIHQQWVF